MSSALIVYASRHGGTAGIAERIATVMREAGIATTLAKAGEVPDPAPYDACVVGSGVYMGSWLKDGLAYLDRFAPELAERPVWLFSSGPLPGSTKTKPTETPDTPADLIESALGPAEGIGSGGRRRLEEIATRIRPRGHRVFLGAYDPNDPPKVMSERLVRMIPGSKGILPAGDFREWPAIEAWARELAAALTPEVVAG